MPLRVFLTLQAAIILAAGLSVWAFDLLGLPMVLVSAAALLGALALRKRG